MKNWTKKQLDTIVNIEQIINAIKKMYQNGQITLGKSIDMIGEAIYE